MMTNALPWTELNQPKSDYVVQRISSESWATAYWAVDNKGDYLFIVKLQGDFAQLYQKQKVDVRGISSRLEQIEPNKQQLVLCLDRKSNADIFFDLCRGIFPLLEKAKDSEGLLLGTLKHLKRWKAFLSGKKNPLMKPIEQRGLFAELEFLEKLSESMQDGKAAVSAWTGPEQVQQDFLFSGKAVEVKSLFGTDRNTVRISSEDQLKTTEKQLFLVAFNLHESSAEDAISLNQKVDAVSKLVEYDSDALFELQSKLKKYGYDPMPEYDAPKYIVATPLSWAVTGNFPKLTRDQLPIGVVRVAYQLELDKLVPFECPFETTLKEL